MDAQRHWIGYDTFKLIVALILLILFIILLLQWGGQAPAAAPASQAATATQAPAAPSATLAPSPVPPSPTAAATALPSPTPAPASPTTAPTATAEAKATVLPSATPTPAAPPKAAPAVQAAAPQPSVTALDLLPGKRVRLQFANLPPNVEFVVRMGSALVTHVSSPDGGPLTLWLEIPADMASSPRIDVRIDSPSGLSAATTFDNMAALGPAVLPATPTAVFVPHPSLTVLHVQKGGIVIAVVSGLPAYTNYTVTVGKAGTQGIGGYPIAHLNTGSVAGASLAGTYEIPVPLQGEASLDLRLEAAGAVYVVNFKNTDF